MFKGQDKAHMLDKEYVDITVRPMIIFWNKNIIF